MRAGSLSDPRIVALLKKYFVCVHMTELCTKELIEDPRDVALLERYHESSGGLFFGGEREAFFTPAGKLVDVFLSLNQGTRQLTRAGRAATGPAVRRFFKAAEKVYRATHGALPDDWAALREGTAPEVAAVRAAMLPRAHSTPARLRLRLAMRHDWMMYEDLAGWEDVEFTADEAGRLVPPPRVGAEQTWPRELFVRLARRLHPRGGGVAIEVADSSITGSLVARATAVTATGIRGTIKGRFRLQPKTDRERSRRDTYRPFRSCEGRLHGDFVWDRMAQRIARLRIVGVDCRVESTWKDHGNKGVHACALGIEALPYEPRPQARIPNFPSRSR